MIFRGLYIPEYDVIEEELDKHFLFNVFEHAYQGKLVLAQPNSAYVKLETSSYVRSIYTGVWQSIKESELEPKYWKTSCIFTKEMIEDSMLWKDVYGCISWWVGNEITKTFSKYDEIVLMDAIGKLQGIKQYEWTTRQVLDYWWSKITFRNYNLCDVENYKSFQAEITYKVAIEDSDQYKWR